METIQGSSYIPLLGSLGLEVACRFEFCSLIVFSDRLSFSSPRSFAKTADPLVGKKSRRKKKEKKRKKRIRVQIITVVLFSQNNEQRKCALNPETRVGFAKPRSLLTLQSLTNSHVVHDSRSFVYSFNLQMFGLSAGSTRDMAGTPERADER